MENTKEVLASQCLKFESDMAVNVQEFKMKDIENAPNMLTDHREFTFPTEPLFIMKEINCALTTVTVINKQ